MSNLDLNLAAYLSFFQDIKNLTELTLMDFTLDLKSVLMFSQLRVLCLMKLLIDDHMSESSLSLPED